MLFRGQPEVEEETGEFDDDGNPKIRRRKADDEHLIREALLNAHLIDAVIALPLNVFYGAGVPACLLILNKNRPPARQGKVLMVYAARHFRELSAQNELRPQDVMRMLVHYHAYGDAAKVPKLLEAHTARIRKQIEQRENEECARLVAEYEPHAEKLTALDATIAAATKEGGAAKTAKERKTAETKREKAEKAREKCAAKLAERDERIAEARRRAEDDRRELAAVAEELVALYADPDELLKHARVVAEDEIAENEFNLNIPRYVDTFEPEPRIEVKDALKALREAESKVRGAEESLRRLLGEVGYAG